MRTLISACIAMFGVSACATAPKPVAPIEKHEAAPVAKAAPKVDEATSPPERDDVGALLKGIVVHFDFDRADLSSDSQKRLDTLADALRSHPAVHIKVAGNCDELGTEEYNLALGQRRADAVKTYLGHLGVGSGRVDTVTYGEEKPLDSSHTPEAWSANRRDDFDRTN
jgi:peptidoglycan-associated lipoprotein